MSEHAAMVWCPIVLVTYVGFFLYLRAQRKLINRAKAESPDYEEDSSGVFRRRAKRG
jgi:hypothetical protein